MIGLTAVIAIGGLISAAIFGFQLYLMKVATDLTRESIEISQRAIVQSREALIATQRPWLTLEAEAIGPLTWQDGGMQLEIQVTAKNTGLTPALRTHVFATLDPNISGRKGIQYCEAERGSSNNGRSTEIVFPGATLVVPKLAKADPNELDSAKLKDGSFRATVTVCISYESALDQSAHHQTLVTFDLYRAHMSPDGRVRVDPKDGELAVADMDFSYRHGTNFAD